MRALLLLSLLLLGPDAADALHTTSKVATKGHPMEALEGWPAGSMKVINHRYRTGGWHSMFSECPNDVYYFGIGVETPGELQRFLRAFAAIEAGQLVVSLQASEEGKHVEGAAAALSLGNQPIIDRWFKRLPLAKPGVRRFGVHRYTEPPKALPPTVTIYVGHQAIDLAKLRLPAGMELRASISVQQRKARPELSAEIDRYLERHAGERRPE